MAPIGLNGSVRLVQLQFSFNNAALIPTSLRVLPDETMKQHVERKVAASSGIGVELISPTENIGVALATEEILGNSDYVLVDVQYQTRIGGAKGTYHMLRFVFARKEYAYPNKEVDLVDAREALRRICREAMWRVRAYMNPFFRNGVSEEEQFMVSANFEARKPLFDGASGEPIMVWKRDENGERIEGSKAPLQPAIIFHIGEKIRLETK